MGKESMPAQSTCHIQWSGDSEAVGEAARLMAPPPPVILFAFWPGTCVMSEAQHAMRYKRYKPPPPLPSSSIEE